MAKRDPIEFMDNFKVLMRTVRTIIGQEYAEQDLGETQAAFLRYIGRTPRISQADLARATQSDPGLTGRVLEALIEKAWVVRTRDEEDRRQYLLELTSAGQRVRKRAEDARARAASNVVAQLDERDLEALERISRKLEAAFPPK